MTDFFEQETVAIPSDKQDGTHPFLVINDLTQEDRFGQLPFVKGAPHARFYAGTPLTTDNNINIGCLFVLDHQPHEGLSDIEKDALGTVAAMVMDYLQVSRQAVEGRRASRLSKGLRLFVDGNCSFADNSHLSRSNSSNSSWSSQGSPYLGSSRSTSSHKSDSELPLPQAEIGDARAQDGDARSLSPVSNETLDRDIFANAATSLPNLRPNDSNSSVSSTSNDWIFQRAANLLRQSLDLDGTGGVMFSRISDHSPDNVADSPCNPADSNTSAPVLAMSTQDDPLFYQAVSMASSPAVSLDNDFLNQLTVRYPKGRLWSFHNDGTLTTSDEEQSVSASRKQRNKSRASETSKLNTYFPDACQVMFVPLWNAINSQWFAGCFCWTPQPTRIFNRAVDLSSTFGFASSLMTEYSRVESVIADRQKGDFISSISHELRSPLHGVLAAAELFGDTGLDEYQESLIETINACGRTLLDTMNQVLDFSKIMSLERQKRRHTRRKDPWRRKATEQTPARMDPFVSTDLAVLTEDVVDSVCLGHSHIQRSTTSTNHSPTLHSKPANEDNEAGSGPDVEVVVKISNRDWLYNVQPGSLRRIIMNILGNALKYTKEGLISVCIDATQRSKGRERSRRQGLEDMVTLTISDTGRGISSEYLRTRLYTPFAQEDTLSVGTGLGLSIVRGIVRTLDGTINIQSQVGEGTIVKVSFPLERPGGEEDPSSTLHVENLAQKTLTACSQLRHLNFTGKRAAIWGTYSSCPIKHQFWSSIAQYVTDWYGLQIVPWSANEDVDALFVDERDLSAEKLQDFPTALPRLLLFCNDSAKSGDSRAKWSHLADYLVILRRPCGPQRLAKGILSCLNPKPASSTSRAVDLGEEFVVPERPKPASLSPSAGELRLSSGNPGSPTAESPNPLPGSHVRGIDSANGHNSSVLGPDTEMLGGAISPNTALNNPAPLSSDSSALVDVSSESRSRPRVLLVDDNEINIRLLLTFMKHRKVMVVDTAENGRAAVDSVERNLQGYDLIFMDISMPIMDGVEATRAIRALEKERDGCVSAKIIAFTGLSSVRDESKALDAGVDLFLTKPVSFKEVSRLINDWETISN